MSKLVIDQNYEIRESIEKLKGQQKEIQFIGYQQSQQGKVNKDSVDKMNLTIKQFQIVKAQLNRLVVSQEEIVEEVQDGQTKNCTLLQGLDTNMKIRVFGKIAPLTIKVQYPDKPVIKKVGIFLSHLVKQPDEESNTFHYNNPSIVNV